VTEWALVKAFKDWPIEARIQRYEWEPRTSPIRPASSEWCFTVIGRTIIVFPRIPRRLVRNNVGKRECSEGGIDLPITHKDMEIVAHGSIAFDVES
jgi:hypothetical protein